MNTTTTGRQLSDAAALEQIAELLRPECNSCADFYDAVAELVALTGRDLGAGPEQLAQDEDPRDGR